jgi:cystathionine beta-synthase
MNNPVGNHSVNTSEAQPRFQENILQTIGHTPLVRLNHVTSGAACTVLAKVEFFNPGGSVKDRIGPTIIEDAEQRGLLKPGGTIVEATSGNTGAGLAIAAAVKGYKCVFVMPDKMSDEKVRFLRAFGARVVITPTAVTPDDPRSNYAVARRIAAETPNAFLANQYHNPANPEAHYQTTGPEVWKQTAGQVGAVVAGMGTGGTITGLGRYLKERNPGIQLVGVDILGSLLYDTWKLGHVPTEPFLKTYKIEGIGEDFVPDTLDLKLLDEVVQVGDREAFGMGRRLVREEGIYCGGSSGAAVAGLLKSQIIRAMPAGQIAVVILPDSGDRYLSKMFDDTWMRENGFLAAGWPGKTVTELLNSQPHRELTIAHPEDRMSAVAARMKTHDISQVPVVDGQGQLIGIVTEMDLLEHLLHSGHIHNQSETIAAIINPTVSTVPTDVSVEKVLNAVDCDKVVIVAEAGRPVGILTKTDLIDYITAQISHG